MTTAFDPYRTLGVRRDATEADIKAAHRRLAKRFHPDAGGDHERFVRIQEAYRLLTDPLRKKEWDARHAPGPLRADAPNAAPRPPRAARRPAPSSGGAASQDASRPGTSADDAGRRPRSARAYTWSAADVPWWEEGVSENRRQPGRKRPARPGTRPGAASSAPPGEPAEAAPPEEPPNAFDVYNRSSGAAWSMAARAYFRRGDQDLPRRGTFRYEGTQVVTGGRARTAAQAEARRRSATAVPPPEPAATDHASARPFAAAEATAGVARDPRRILQVREAWRRRTSAAAWPTLGERLLFALVAWVPLAMAIAFGVGAATGCSDTRQGCPAYLETAQEVAIALSLGLLVALPKVAYIGAVATVGALFVGLGIVAVAALTGVEVPLSAEMSAMLGGVIVLGYAATALIMMIRRPASRPWYAGPGA